MKAELIKKFIQSQRAGITGILLIIFAVLGFPRVITTLFPLLANDNLRFFMGVVGILLLLKSVRAAVRFAKEFSEQMGKDETRSEKYLQQSDRAVIKGESAGNRFIYILLVLFALVFIYENRDHLHGKSGSTPVVETTQPVRSEPKKPEPPVQSAAHDLYQAVTRRDLSKVRELLPRLQPGEINAVTGGMTPVMQASSLGDAELVGLLITQGADPNKRGSLQRTALQYAAERNRLVVAKVLLEHGADINGTDNSRLSPLIMAADRRYREFALYLLEKGADVNIQHVQGWTALIDAARNGDLVLVQRLVESGADIHRQMPNGWSALDFARNNNHAAVESFLLKQYER